MTTLGERGLLPNSGDVEEEQAEPEEAEAEPLSEDFGEDLVPEEEPIVMAGE